MRIFLNAEFRLVWAVLMTGLVLFLLGGMLWNAAVLDKTPPIGSMSGVVESTEMRADGVRVLNLKWTGIRQRHCVGSVQRWIIGSSMYQLPPAYFSARKDETIGQLIEYKSVVEIPPSFVAKQGYYRAITTYQCNLMQVHFPVLSLTIPLPLIPFDLTDDDK